MSAQLVPLTAGAAPTIPLQRPVILIGRHPECDVQLPPPQISRRHCCVALAYDRLVIRDLGSRNGVRVNGLRVHETRLWPGDEIAIAHLIFRLEAPESATDPRAAPGSSGAPGVTPDPPPAQDELRGDLVALDDTY